MDGFNDLTQKAQKVNLTYEEQQKTGWDTTENYHKTAKIDTANGALYKELDTKDMKGLRDELLRDEDSKTEGFTAMYEAVNNLVSLAQSKGRLIDEEGRSMTADFFETLFGAKQQVNQYLYTHSGYKWTKKGERRIQIVSRLKKILDGLDAEVIRVQASLSEEKARRIDYEKEGISEEEIERLEKQYKLDRKSKDIMLIATTGAYGPGISKEDAAKIGETWALKGYTAKLEQLISKSGVMEDDSKLDDFLAFLEDQNNRLMANKLAVGMVLDQAVGTTLGMPWIKKELRLYLEENLSDEVMLGKTEEIPAKVNELINDFRTENSDRLNKFIARRDRFSSELHIPADVANLYDYPVIEEIFAEPDDAVFEEQLASLKNRVVENDRQITGLLKNRYSIGTRNSISQRLVRNLGSLRIFGTMEQILEQTNVFCDMLKYTAPREYMVERTIENVMSSLKIDVRHRDAFVASITDGHPETLLDYGDISWKEFWKVRGSAFAERYAANIKEYAKSVDEKGLYLIPAQWEELETVSLNAGILEAKDFKDMIKSVTERQATGEKLSHREFLERRKFKDAQKEPARIKRALREQKIIDSLGDSMNERFVIMFLSDGSNPFLPYRRLDAAYKGNEVRQKQIEASEERLFEERKNDVKHVLQKAGLPKNRWDQYVNGSRWMISGILETGDGMTDDERLACERVNLERFGVRTWDEALTRFRITAEQLTSEKGRKELEDTQKKHQHARRLLEEYDGGKYSELSDFLVMIPDVYRAMITSSEDEFKWYCANTLDVRLSGFMDGVKSTEMYSSVRKQYAYSYLRSIYEGKITGDGAFFAEQLKNYSRKVMEIKPDGTSSIAGNIKTVEKEIDKLLKTDRYKKLPTAHKTNLKVQALYIMYEKMNTTEGFLKLFDSKGLKGFAKETLKQLDESTQDTVLTKQIDSLLTTGDTFSEDNDFDTANVKALMNIEKVKDAGIKSRYRYLRTDVSKLEKIRLGKSLVRVGAQGRNLVSLNTSKADHMRGRIEKYCGNLKLPPVLRDALVEEGASESIKDRLMGIMWSDDELVKHATAMDRMYSFLRKDAPDDSAMSDEEAQMYIVKCYADKGMRSLFDNTKGPNVSQMRKSEDYKIFRANYRKLKEFEAVSADDPSFDREMTEMSRNLRTMLITGIGTLNASGKNVDTDKLSAREKREYNAGIGEIIERNKKYAERSSLVAKLIRDAVEEYNEERDIRLSFHNVNLHVFALREYFLDTIIKECEEGDAYDENRWKERIAEVRENKAFWDNMLFNRNSISNTDLKKAEDKRIESDANEQTISDAIKANVFLFNGKVNKYEQLDEDQKKFFAVALMLMDKGSIGMGTEGTSALLTSREDKSDLADRIQKELQKYIEGRPYHIDVDYKDAFNKLINYGETKVFYTEGYALSVSAYERALQFAQTVYAKKAAFGEKDVERLNDGYSSINAAYTKYGKNQLNTVDNIRDEFLTPKDIKDRLIEFARADIIDTKTIIMDTAKAAVTQNLRFIKQTEKDTAHNRRMRQFTARFKKMSDSDLKLFIRIMQERTLLDKTTAPQVPGGPEYADQEKRNAFLEALCADAETRESVLAGFDDDDSCHQALISALSFQLRDDANFKGKELTKEHFAKDALDRTTLIDWDLIERAFLFMDEVKEKRASVYALQHASDYIAQSGNKEAIRENKKLEKQFTKKDTFTRNTFEQYIMQQSKKDGGEDIERALGGYMSLTDKEKNLFFTVLARRDLLDISKKDYSKSFFGLADRNYVNQADRDKLIDRYIESSLEDNIGIQLSPTAHYDALKSLFSTQISDSEKFDSKKDISKMTAGERYLFMSRNTAIDWKLFKRALNFVNRATEELEYREGNAQLYRGAGNLSENGMMSMNYSFLRKNFHRTGNHWGRFVGRMLVKTVRDETHVSDYLDMITTGLSATKEMVELAGFDEKGVMMSGLQWVTDKSNELKDNFKKIGTGDNNAQIVKLGIAAKPKTDEEKAKDKEKEEKAKQAEKKRRDELLYYDRIKEGIDGIIAQSKSAKDAAQDVAVFIRDNFATQFELGRKFIPAPDVKATEDKKNLVNVINKDGVKDNSYGDVRDTAANAVNTIKSVNATVNEKLEYVKMVPAGKEVLSLCEYAAQKATYKFINEKILGIDTDMSKIGAAGNNPETLKKEAEALKKSATVYAKNVFEEIVRGSIGDGAADFITDIEQGYYNVKKVIGDQITAAVKGIAYAKKCVTHIQNITKSAANIKMIRDSRAVSGASRVEDDNKLEKAKDRRLTEKQAAKVKAIVDKHRDLGGLGNEIATALQSFNITEEALNLAFETAAIAGGKLNFGQNMLAASIKAGLEFAMYAIRVVTDRTALNGYFIDTASGSAVVDKLKAGFQKAGNTKMLKTIDERIKAHKEGKVDVNTSLVDIISDARGYEHTSELVENTGMSLAQSIVFSASRFNPMAETRITAITVMSVMGLADQIGDTSPSTVEKLFIAFKMNR